MKNLSKLVLGLGVVVLSGLALLSCNNDHLHPEKFWVSYGMVSVDGETKSYDIQTDEGERLYIAETVVPLWDIIDGNRVIVNYHILNTNTDGHDIRLNALSNIPVKDPLMKSSQTEEIIEGLGQDPVNLLQAPFFSFGEYLTVIYEVTGSSANITHDYNLLVYENKNVDERENELTLELRHNAHNDYGYGSTSNGRIAFKAGSLIPAGKDEIKVTFKWKNIKGEDRSENMLLKRKTE